MERIVYAEGFEVGGGDGAAGVVRGGGGALWVLAGWWEEGEKAGRAYGEVVVDPRFHFECVCGGECVGCGEEGWVS